jgi:hypothetical protein
MQFLMAELAKEEMLKPLEMGRIIVFGRLIIMVMLLRN